jgi:hypothetical protein
MENRGFWALEVPPKRGKHENTKGPIYRQNKMSCQARGALDCRRCNRS